VKKFSAVLLLIVNSLTYLFGFGFLFGEDDDLKRE
jgi:hypothetical protein